MADEANQVDRIVAPAPREPDRSLGGSFLWRQLITCEEPNTGGFQMNTTMRKMFEKQLIGCGRVEVKSIYITYLACKSGLSVAASVVNAISTEDCSVLGMERGNFMVVSNALNTGIQQRHDLEIPGWVSRQIQPVSSLLPDFRLSVAADRGMKLHVEVVLEVFGMMTTRVKSSALNL
jgi:hypothetical protein